MPYFIKLSHQKLMNFEEVCFGRCFYCCCYCYNYCWYYYFL